MITIANNHKVTAISPEITFGGMGPSNLLNTHANYYLPSQMNELRIWEVMHKVFQALSSNSREGNGTLIQYSCLENSMDGGAWWAAVHGSLRVGHYWATSLSLFTFMNWRRKWQPTPVLLAWRIPGMGSLMGCRLWGHTESDTTEVT